MLENLRGGGILLVAIKNGLDSHRINLDRLSTAFPSIDIVDVKISNSSRCRFILLVIYIPPSIQFDRFVQFIEELIINLNSFNGFDIVVVGDFNVPSYDADLDNRYTIVLRNFQNLLNFQQFNNVLNNQGCFLDLMFSNINYSVQHVNHYKEALFILNDEPRYNFKKVNFALLYNLLLNANWSLLNEAVDIHEACDLLYNIIYNIFELTVPKITAKCSKKYIILLGLIEKFYYC